jgi:hypothetical protein
MLCGRGLAPPGRSCWYGHAGGREVRHGSPPGNVCQQWKKVFCGGGVHPAFSMSPLSLIDCVAIGHPGQVRRRRTAIRDPERIIPKMSDLEAPATNSGGRKARPYDGQVNPFGRGGVYPRPQRTDRSANPCIGGSLNLGQTIFQSNWIPDRAPRSGARPE